MGKGTIISGGTGGQYQLQVNYNRVAYDAELVKLTAQISEWGTKISDKEAEIIALENEYDYLVTNQFLPEVLAAKRNEIAAAEKEKASLTIYKLSFEKRKQYLEDNMPADETVSAWCADLTEDLSGSVGTVEVPGESTNIQIQPGHGGNATYNGARDGVLTPILTQTAAQAFYNLAMLPGWQKWRPLFRYATITAIDGDTASITLDNIFSSQQALEINQTDTISGVEIDYMSCNGSAFSVGDEVLVKFTGQAWSAPVIIGFKEEPKPCEFYIRIKCNGITPTISKTISLWYTDGNGDQARQSASSSESEPDLCGPFTDVYFPATIGLHNGGVPDDAAHPDQTSKRLFHFWQEVDPEEYPSANYLVSKVEDAGYVNGSLKQTLTNTLYTGEPSASLAGETVIISPVNYRKLSTQLTTIPSESTIFNFDGLKILQRRTTLNTLVRSDPALCSCGFSSGTISSVPDPDETPKSDFQSVVYADEELVYNIDHEFVAVDDAVGCGTDLEGAVFVGSKYYDGDALNPKSLVILTDSNGDSPTHEGGTFSYWFNGIIQAYEYYLEDDGSWGGPLFPCTIEKTELITQTWVLEMIDTPEDRF